MREIDVTIAGAGPTGLMLARDLGLARAQPLAPERQPERRETPKANGFNGQIVALPRYLIVNHHRFRDLDHTEGPPRRHGSTSGVVGTRRRRSDHRLWWLACPHKKLRSLAREGMTFPNSWTARTLIAVRQVSPDRPVFSERGDALD